MGALIPLPTAVHKQLSKDSTLYQYKLLKRIYHPVRLYWLYWLLPISWWGWDLFHSILWVMPLSLLAVLLLHCLLTGLLFNVKEKRKFAGWLWRARMPWFGWIPGNYVMLGILRRLQLQVFGISLALICCLYPWLPIDLFAHLVFAHLWLSLPRLWVLLRLSRCKSQHYIKLNEQDTSCYQT